MKEKLAGLQLPDGFGVGIEGVKFFPGLLVLGPVLWGGDGWGTVDDFSTTFVEGEKVLGGDNSFCEDGAVDNW